MWLAQRCQRIKTSPTLAIEAKAKALQAKGVDLISFGAGEPDFDTPQYIKDAAIEAIEEGFTKYTPPGGIEELKDAIIDKLQKNGLTFERLQIIVSCGAKHVLFNLIQAIIEDSDAVIIPSPYWVSYPDMVLLAGGKPVILPTSEENDFKIVPQELESVITSKTKAVIINNPSNPTGTIYFEEELRDIAKIALDRKILIISDEIYEKFVYDGLISKSIASLGEEIKDLTLVINGVSKSYAMTGWRIGYGAGSAEIIGAMTKIQSQSTSNPTSISQKAALRALKESGVEMDRMIKEFEIRRNYMVERLNSLQGVSCLRPAGAFYAFPKFSNLYGNKVKNSVELAEYLLEEAKVAVVPGVAFGADEYVRLSYATSLENIKKGLDRIEEVLKGI